MSKRKRQTHQPKSSSSSRSQPDHSLYIQAYEATLIRDQPELAAALERRDDQAETTARNGLIRWCADGEEEDVWVDRFDARLLLTSLPTPVSSTKSPARPHADVSAVGWDDLPSDSEDTFFMSPSEILEYRRNKRARTLDDIREDRLRALKVRDAEEKAEKEEVGKEMPNDWGGDDEEPDEPQKDFMRRTASHIQSSANPGQLEMRILANHGSDPRFAFLRGRWKDTWNKIKQDVSSKESDTAVGRGSAMGALAGYEDSGVDEEE